MTTIDLSEADDEEKEQAIPCASLREGATVNGSQSESELDAKRRDTKYGATLIEEDDE